jgi:tetratricopeptide (TPR) repeat protein
VERSSKKTTWYVTPMGTDMGMLLYVFPFDGAQGEGVREQFFAFLKSLERMGRNEGDGERLVAFHHTVDCGFVLTGRGAESANLAPIQGRLAAAHDVSPTPWDEVLELIRRGEYGQAQQRCHALVEAQPYHLSAYVVGSMLANVMGQLDVAEEMALIGGKYFPKDGLLRYYLGLSRLMDGDVERALGDFRQAVLDEPNFVLARMMFVLGLIELGRHRFAMHILRGRKLVVPDDPRLDAELARLASLLRMRRWVLRLGVALLLLAGLVLLFNVWGALFLCIPAVLSLVGPRAVLRRHVRTLGARYRQGEVAHGLRYLHHRDAAGVLVS